MDVAADGSALGPTNTTAPANRSGVSNGAAAGVVVAGVTVPGAQGSCARGAFARSSGHDHDHENWAASSLVWRVVVWLRVLDKT